MNFRVTAGVETRSDNPDLKGYKVRLNNKKYILYYDKDVLREVYFMSEHPKSFMSCRVDMKTISYYFYDDANKTIKRYENGQHNQTYSIVSPTLTICNCAGVERRYEVHYTSISTDFQNKLYNDLVSFLNRFTDLGLTKLFAFDKG